MDQVTEEQREIYRKMWTQDSYRERSPGMRFLEQALYVAAPALSARIIDLGCGTGRVCAELQRLGYQDVTGLDIAPNACTEYAGSFVESCLWEWSSGEQYHLGFCFDVMEHIPTEKVEQTLSAIYAHCDAAYFQIANFVCHEGDVFGYHLHPTVKPMQWWVNKIGEAGFTIQSQQPRPKHHILYVTR